MIWGTVVTTIGVGIMGLTFLPGITYTIIIFVGYALFGLGLGIYATPSTDTAVSNSPPNKVGEASGLYKMASSLGNSFGVAISAAVYEMLTARNVDLAATAGIITNVIFGILALLSIVFLVPGSAGKGGKPKRKTPAPTYFKIDKKKPGRQHATK